MFDNAGIGNYTIALVISSLNSIAIVLGTVSAFSTITTKFWSFILLFEVSEVDFLFKTRIENQEKSSSGLYKEK